MLQLDWETYGDFRTNAIKTEGVGSLLDERRGDLNLPVHGIWSRHRLMRMMSSWDTRYVGLGEGEGV